MILNISLAVIEAIMIIVMTLTFVVIISTLILVVISVSIVVFGISAQACCQILAQFALEILKFHEEGGWRSKGDAFFVFLREPSVLFRRFMFQCLALGWESNSFRR